VAHKNKKSLTRQLEEKLNSKLAIGESKYLDKQIQVTDAFIYSWSTYKTYLKHLNYFTNYCKENHNCKSLDDCKQYIVEWLNTRNDLSAYTIKLEIAAICKLYNISTQDIKRMGYIVPKRVRANITRSRNDCVRDKHFSESNHIEIVTFCKCFGLRRNELYSLKKENLIFKDNQYFIFVNSGSKGGRERMVPFMGSNDELKIILDYFAICDEKPFAKIPNAMDVHGYRSVYGTRAYLSKARPIEELQKLPKTKSDKGYMINDNIYCMRTDKKGTKYDKQAMLFASQCLGHNRINIIASHYLRDVN
jgi:hypothetical protein